MEHEQMAQGIQKRVSRNGIASYRVQIRQSDGLSDEYTKAFRLKKEKVSHWMPIPAAPSRKK
jgi:hypothetical protein